ncbi:MAG: hypothetical protein KatS3mg130_0754 [Candidatus Sumerlaea sp.]|nr:MAG: hypothetical protein KatS3mg130_0754 [Candidatus Sumerlaea sp.]
MQIIGPQRGNWLWGSVAEVIVPNIDELPGSNVKRKKVQAFAMEGKPTITAHRSSRDARYERLRILYQISNLINSTTNHRLLLRRILDCAVRYLQASSGSLSLIDAANPEFLHVRAACGASARNVRNRRIPIGKGIVGRVVALGKPVRVNNVLECEDYLPLRPEVRSEMAVPLRIEGRIAGVLNVDSDRLNAFTREDQQLLVAIANQAAKVIQTSQLYDALTTQAARLEALIAAGQALIAPDSLPSVLQRITETVQSMLDIRLCSVMLLNEKGELELSAVSGGGQHYTQRPTLHVTNTLVGEVVMGRAPLQVFDVRKAPRYRSRRMARKEKLASLLSVPIIYNDRPIGILNIYTAKPRTFSNEEIQLLNAFASLCAIAIVNARRYQEMVRAEEGLRKAERLSTLGILSAEIAHEIRNPVAIISMLVHSLMEDGAVAPDRQKDLQIIADKLERINRIVTQVLNLSRQQQPRLEEVNLNQVIEDLLFLLSHTLSARSILVKKRLARTLPMVRGERGHFDQVLLNLMLNAIDAMPRGGIIIVATRRATRAGRPHVVVSVRDTGRGIPEEIRDQIFEPFVTTRREGIGLGLFVSRKLLSQYDATLSIKETNEKGTCFEISIPIEVTPQ